MRLVVSVDLILAGSVGRHVWVPKMPSFVELLERLAVMEQGLVRANERIEASAAENAQLRRRFGQTPRNPNMPPRRRGLDTPASKSLRGHAGRRFGGQDGHPGHTLRQVEVPDETVGHEPVVCGRCGSGPADMPLAAVTRRQVFEIPGITARVTEHQLNARRCLCGM
jgi:transposase